MKITDNIWDISLNERGKFCQGQDQVASIWRVVGVSCMAVVENTFYYPLLQSNPISDLRKFVGPVTLTLTLDDPEYYIVRFVLSTSIHSGFEIVDFCNFDGPVTLTLTLDIISFDLSHRPLSTPLLNMSLRWVLLWTDGRLD